jgi:SNW domain-containing protein 1
LGDDESYNIYDQPWNSSIAVASQIYKPTRTATENYDDTEALISASKRFVVSCLNIKGVLINLDFRFEQECGFKGADRAAARDGPVQFQREEDPFGLTDFLKDVRHGCGSATSANPSSGSSSKRVNTHDREERSTVKRHKK